MKQQKGEFLRDYAARFNAATLKVKNFNEFVAMTALKQGLKSNRFIFSSNKNYLNNYEQMLVRVWKYAQIKKEESILHQVKREGGRKKQPQKEDRRKQQNNADRL